MPNSEQYLVYVHNNIPTWEHNMSAKDSYTLREVANWQLADNGNVVVPRLQRGLVWNAARIEVFWDSLMRQIPVGVFCLSNVSNEMKCQLKIPNNSNDCYFLLDGQQRANSIALGYRPFPGDSENDKASILWLDLRPEGMLDSRCKYAFHVTTCAHPWGFATRTKDRETGNDKLSYSEMREGVLKMKEIDRDIFLKNPTYRPLPNQLYPIKANLPIPFCFLTKASEDQEDFGESLLRQIQASRGTNWHDSFHGEIVAFLLRDNCLCEIKKSLEVLKNAKIHALYVPENIAKDPDAVSLFFDRMNTQGVVPGVEERNFSMAKAFWPELWSVEPFAKNRMLPYRMATLALETFLTPLEKDEARKKGWCPAITNNAIRELSKDENTRNGFSEFIHDNSSEFYMLCRKVDRWMGFVEAEKERQDWSLLPFHRTLIAQKSLPIYKLMLLLARLDKDNTLEPQLMAGLMTMLRWFSNNDELLAKNIFDSCRNLKKTGNSTLWDCIQAGILDSVNQGLLLVPATPDELKEIFNTPVEEKKGYWFSISSKHDFPKWSGVERICGGFGSDMGAELLLYSVREYMHMFNYDPSEHEKWESYNRPWDYDHILPQDWLGNRGAAGNGPWMDACRNLLGSIGNSVPLPFSMNRAKQADPPTKNYCNGNKGIAIDYDKIDTYKKEPKLDCDEKRAKEFIEITKERFNTLYSNWFNNLKIADILNVSAVAWSNRIQRRHDLFTAVHQKLKGNGKIFFVERGFQFPVQDKMDWSRPWLAVGIVRDDDFVCIASDGMSIELGIRRHPAKKSIDNSSDKWWHTHKKTLSYNDSKLYEEDADRFYNEIAGILETTNTEGAIGQVSI